jgi:hypothetical protein
MQFKMPKLLSLSLRMVLILLVLLFNSEGSKFKLTSKLDIAFFSFRF